VGVEAWTLLEGGDRQDACDGRFGLQDVLPLKPIGGGPCEDIRDWLCEVGLTCEISCYGPGRLLPGRACKRDPVD
jgi:hypothetical protein